MAHPRKRNDTSPTVYQITNRLIGESGEWALDQREMNKLSLMIRQADRLFCVQVMSFQVTATGYSLICSAPAELPSPEELRRRYTHRYAARREVPDFDDPEVYGRWAARLRNFSCLIKDIQQRFTQWYNRVVREGKRKGTLWKSRFQSGIIKTAGGLLTTIKKSFGKMPPRWRKVRAKKWRKMRKGRTFIRDAIAPILGASGSTALLFACVFMDELGRLPQAPFPLKDLRDFMNKRMRDYF